MVHVLNCVLCIRYRSTHIRALSSQSYKHRNFTKVELDKVDHCECKNFVLCSFSLSVITPKQKVLREHTLDQNASCDKKSILAPVYDYELHVYTCV